MKHFVSSIFLVAISSQISNAQELPVIPADYDYGKINEYFNKCLQSQIESNYSVVPFDGEGYSINTNDVSAMSDMIWDYWVSVNNAFDEQKLNSGKKIYAYSKKVQWSYNIPASLEPYIAAAEHPGDTGVQPYARMKYVYGSKGTLNGPAPMFINMHGSGDVSDEWNLALSAACCGNTNPLEQPSIYFVAQIPNGWNTYYRWYQLSKQWVWEKLFRQAFLRSEIDNNGLFFIGISEGAYGSQRLGAFYADYLAGIGPMAGGEPLTNAPCENMRHVAFCLRTGVNDTQFYRSTLTQYAGEYLDDLAERYPGDYPHNVIVEPGQAHTLLKYNEGTTPWLIQYRRNATPKHVNWENFAMDGRYRDGVYNLRVIKRSNTDEEGRGYYEMDIDDNNNIDMKVSTVYNQIVDGSYSLPLVIKKNYAPATTGRFKIYLNDKLVDMTQPVTLTVNGRKLYEGMITPTINDIVNSIADFYDPERIFTSSIEVDLDSMTAKAPVAGIDNVTADNTDSAPEYYNLQGIKVTNPVSGQLYIKRQGTTTTKVIM